MVACFQINEDRTILSSIDNESMDDDYVGSMIVSERDNLISFYNLGVFGKKQQGYAKELLTTAAVQMKEMFPNKSFLIESEPFNDALIKILARSYFKIFKNLAKSIKITPKYYPDGELRSYVIKGSF